MAKKRSFVRRSFTRAAKTYRKSSKPSLSVIDVLLAGAVYGAVRPTVANMLPTFFTFGPVDSDNVILGGLGFFAATQKNKMFRAIGTVALATEASIVTSKLIAPSNGTISAIDSY